MVRKPRVDHTQGGVEPQWALSASLKRTSGVKNSNEYERRTKPIPFGSLDVHAIGGEGAPVGHGLNSRPARTTRAGASESTYAFRSL